MRFALGIVCTLSVITSACNKETKQNYDIGSNQDSKEIINIDSEINLANDICNTSPNMNSQKCECAKATLSRQDYIDFMDLNKIYNSGESEEIKEYRSQEVLMRGRSGIMAPIQWAQSITSVLKSACQID